MRNIAFDKSCHRDVLAHRAHTPDEHASAAHFEELLIVSYLRRHPTTLVDATKAYAEAMSLSVNLFIEKSECMAKEFQVARRREEELIGSTRAEMEREILSQVSSPERVTQRLYDRFITVHKAFFHLHGHQKRCSKTL